jgi:hypothetical protein
MLALAVRSALTQKPAEPADGGAPGEDGGGASRDATTRD